MGSGYVGVTDSTKRMLTLPEGGRPLKKKPKGRHAPRGKNQIPFSFVLSCGDRNPAMPGDFGTRKDGANRDGGFAADQSSSDRYFIPDKSPDKSIVPDKSYPDKSSPDKSYALDKAPVLDQSFPDKSLDKSIVPDKSYPDQYLAPDKSLPDKYFAPDQTVCPTATTSTIVPCTFGSPVLVPHSADPKTNAKAIENASAGSTLQLKAEVYEVAPVYHGSLIIPLLKTPPCLKLVGAQTTIILPDSYTPVLAGNLNSLILDGGWVEGISFKSPVLGSSTSSGVIGYFRIASGDVKFSNVSLPLSTNWSPNATTLIVGVETSASTTQYASATLNGDNKFPYVIVNPNTALLVNSLSGTPDRIGKLITQGAKVNVSGAEISCSQINDTSATFKNVKFGPLETNPWCKIGQYGAAELRLFGCLATDIENKSNYFYDSVACQSNNLQYGFLIDNQTPSTVKAGGNYFQNVLVPCLDSSGKVITWKGTCDEIKSRCPDPAKGGAYKDECLGKKDISSLIPTLKGLIDVSKIQCF